MFTLPEHLLRRASSDPSKTAYQFFQGKTLSREVLTYHELWEQAAALAHVLQSHGLSKERVVLVCKSQKSFVVSFFGCLLAGTIAVPAPVPRRPSLLHRLQLLARDAEANFILTDCDEKQRAEWTLEGAGLDLLDVGQCVPRVDQAGLAVLWRPPDWSEDGIAFLQYTSGSTGDPKGVVISSCESLA